MLKVNKNNPSVTQPIALKGLPSITNSKDLAQKYKIGSDRTKTTILTGVLILFLGLFLPFCLFKILPP